MDDLITKYFENTLSDREKLLFEKELSENESFRSEFEFQKELQNAIQVSERRKIKQKIQRFESAPNSSVFQFRRYLKYAAILITLVSVGIYFFMNQNSSEHLYATYYEAYPNTEISVTRSNTDKKSSLEDAFVAYDLNNYEKANQLFDETLKTNESDYIRFYKALCLMELNQHKEALKVFESINPSSNYYDKFLWFKALSLIKLNNKAEAKLNLEKLVSKGSFKFNEAEELLSKL